MPTETLKSMADADPPKMGEFAISRKKRKDHFVNFFADRPVLESVDDSDSIFLNPDPVVNAEAAGLGVGLYDRMLADDAHMRGQWERRVDACIGLGYEIVEAGDTPEQLADAEFVRDIFAAIDGLDDARKGAMKHRLKGYSVVEIVWQSDGNVFFIEKLKVHDPRAFVFGYPKGELRVIEGLDPKDTTPVDMRKFIVLATDATSWNPYGVGLGQTLYYLGQYKKFALQNWHVMGENHSTPTIDATYKEGVGVNKDDALELAEDATTAKAVAHGESIELKPLNTATATNPDIHDKQIARHNDEISVCIVGQVLSSAPRSTGIGSGQSRLADQVEGHVLDSDARDQTAFLSAIARLVILFNRGSRPPNGYPTVVVHSKSEEDQTDDASVVDTLARAGMPIGVKFVRKKFAIPVPQPDEEILNPAGVSVAGIGATGRTSATGANDNTPKDTPNIASFSEGARVPDDGDARIDAERTSVLAHTIDGIARVLDQARRALVGYTVGKRRGTR